MSQVSKLPCAAIISVSLRNWLKELAS